MAAEKAAAEERRAEDEWWEAAERRIEEGHHAAKKRADEANVAADKLAKAAVKQAAADRAATMKRAAADKVGNRHVSGKAQSAESDEAKKQRAFRGILNKLAIDDVVNTPGMANQLAEKLSRQVGEERSSCSLVIRGQPRLPDWVPTRMFSMSSTLFPPLPCSACDHSQVSYDSQILENIAITDRKTLEGLIDQIFDKALSDTSFCEVCAQLCVKLGNAKDAATGKPLLPSFDNPESASKPIDMKRLLLNKCQAEVLKGIEVDSEVKAREETVLTERWQHMYAWAGREAGEAIDFVYH